MPRTLAIAATAAITALLLHGCAGSSATTGAPASVMADESSIAASATNETSPAANPHADSRLDEENNIYFALGSTEVDETGKRKLRAHALRLQQNPKLIVTLTGLTDDSGSRSYNLLVAEKRTEAVAELLRSYGVAKNQIRPYALGNRKPDAPCKTLTCRQKLRRVELNFPPDQKTEANRQNAGRSNP